MSNADENREPELLELNKETLQDLDVGSNAGAVKGGGLQVGYMPPTLGCFTPPTLKTVGGASEGCASAACGAVSR